MYRTLFGTVLLMLKILEIQAQHFGGFVSVVKRKENKTKHNKRKENNEKTTNEYFDLGFKE